MKTIKTYEGFFDFFKRKRGKKKVSDVDRVKNIIDNSNEILYELTDLGYQVNIKKDFSKWADDGYLQIEVTRDHPNPSDENLHRDLLRNELIPVQRRLSRYLKSQGLREMQLVYVSYENPLVWVWQVEDPGKYKTYLYLALSDKRKRQQRWNPNF